MILVVSLNPALDVTHHVAGVDWSGVNRPQQVTTAPGGKGLNVARTLRALGTGVLVIGLAGGVTGEAVRAGLAAAGVPGGVHPASPGRPGARSPWWTPAATTPPCSTSRGPAVAAGEYQEFLVLYENSLAGCDAVVLSGSLPPGLPEDSYAGLTARAAAAAVPVVLDAGGAALRRGAAAGPAIAKPNLAELQAAVRRPLAGPGRRRGRRGGVAGRGGGRGRGVARRRRAARGHRRGDLARGAAGPGGGQPDRGR